MTSTRLNRFFTWLILLVLLLPTALVQASPVLNEPKPNCPPYNPNLTQDTAFVRSLPLKCQKDYKKNTEGLQSESIQAEMASAPDSFGYTWEAAAFSWIDASGSGTNMNLSGDDEYSGPIDIGFPFKFYENTYSQLYANTNGLITFGSGSSEYYTPTIPSVGLPNNLIAPFWDDLAVNYHGYNTGQVYYLQGGTAPNRYFVVQWDQVSLLGNTDLLTFQAVLYENGDIFFQYLSLQGYLSGAAIGIEDNSGTIGLMLPYSPSSNTAVWFSRPAPSARVNITPQIQGGFTQPGAIETFIVQVHNNGEFGNDSYSLSTSSTWTSALYASNGITPISNVGPIPQGGSVEVVVKVQVPINAQLGDHNTTNVTAVSQLDNTKSKTASYQFAIPAAFAQIFRNHDDGAMSLNLVKPAEEQIKKVTPDNYFSSYNPAVSSTPSGTYFYAWVKGRDNGIEWVGEVEYTILNHSGGTVRGITKLTDHSTATVQTYDESPAIAVAPDGRIGLLWSRTIWNSDWTLQNQNIWFAVLDSTGTVVVAPTNITNNAAWGNWNTLNLPHFGSPQIAATGDNRFVLAWERYHTDPAGYVNNIYYTVRNTNGSVVSPVTHFTSSVPSGTQYNSPRLAALANNRILFMWEQYDTFNAVTDLYYVVMNSSGGLVKTAAQLNDTYNGLKPDAAQLPNGKIVIAWTSHYVVYFTTLDASYNLIAAPTYIALGRAVSVTSDSNNNAILTWINNEGLQLHYALVDGNGTVLTPPMIFQSSNYGFETNWAGQGNTTDASAVLPTDSVGVFRPSNGALYLKNSNTTGFADNILTYGLPGDYPIVGDWDGDGIDTIGIYRNGTFYLRNSNTNGFADSVFAFGAPGDQPVAGDWNGDGIDTVGLYRSSIGTFFLRNSNSAGNPDLTFSLGIAGDVGIAGDWNGNGIDTTGVFRPSNGALYLKNTNATGFADLVLTYGLPGDAPVTGDWNSNGTDTIGIYRNGTFYLRNSNTNGFADIILTLGINGDMPIGGNWDGLP